MASLLLLPKFKEFVPGTGNPAVGYKVQTFFAGTSTPQATYSDAGLSSPNTNPVLLDANGEALMYAASGALYKVQYQDNTGAALWTVDNVTIGGGGSSSAIGGWSASGFVPSFISGTSFSVPGDARLTFPAGTRLQTTNTAGTVYVTVVSSAFGGGITTVTISNTAPGDGGSLDSGLSVVNVNAINATNRAIPVPTAARFFSTGSTSLSTTVASTLGSGGTPTTAYDVLSETSAGVFTAKQPGVYRFNAAISLATSGVTFTGNNPQISIGGTGVASVYPQCNTIQTLAATQTYYLVVGGDFKIAAGQTLSCAITCTFSAGTITYQYDVTVSRVSA